MAKIISFISRKGGTGKTTNAINLATTLHDMGHKICLIETDTNYTLNTLRQMELYKLDDKAQNLFEILGSEDNKIADELNKIKSSNKLDYIIVDSAGKTTDEGIKKLAMESSAIIVPTSLTQNDLLVTYQTVTDLTPAREINKNLKIIVLPNRIHSLTGSHTVYDALNNLDAHILQARVPQRTIFVNFSTIKAEKQYADVANKILNEIK
ncbi:MAG: ParA family protein [Cyclobacteriaceae bacterium]|nr:ParA family protein [Cyclobacteriaceae bacterium]